MIGDSPIDRSLQALGDNDLEPPALSDELERELAGLEPVAPRAPWRQWLLFATVSLVVAGAILALLSLRRDLSMLPRAWLVLYAGAWLVAFGALGLLAMVPRKGAVSPRARAAGIAALAVAAGFVVIGLVFARAVPGVSFESPATAGGVLEYGQACLRWGLITAIAPVGLGALLLRGTMPVGARWGAAALGAAGGALGGLMLHLHCHIADRWHMGLIHGGVVVLGTLLASLLVARMLRP